MDEIKINGAKWAEECQLCRRALVKDLRDAEAKRDKIFGVVESLGKDAPNLLGIMERLNVFYEKIKDLQTALNDL